jgi:deoxycytidylate deaminase
MIPCLKQKTRCIILRYSLDHANGLVVHRHEATNECAVDGCDTCPRVTAGCRTGEGYDLCGSTHAEANAAKLAAPTAHLPGVAYLYGHDWVCRECQHALTAVNVRTIVITGEPA